MYKCDKCGCEHTSRTTCPKCGAPVVLVNEDYLRRRREWEEQQKNGTGTDSGSIAERTVAAVLNNGRSSDGKDRERRKEKNDERDGTGTGLSCISSKIGKFLKGIAQKLERRKRHAGEDHTLVMESEDEEDFYEKLIMDHVVFKNRLRKYIFAGVFIAFAAVSAVASIYVIKHRDRSDIVYFDGHELVSVQDGVLYNPGQSGSLIAFSPNMNALLLETGGADTGKGIVGWYEGSEIALECRGNMVNQQLFSKNGRYLAYVTCVDTTEHDEYVNSHANSAGNTEAGDVSADYYLFLTDMEQKSTSAYEYDRQLKLISVTEDGRVIFLAFDTTGYSTVVSASLYVADQNGVCTITDSMLQAVYNGTQDAVVFLSGSALYLCDVGVSALKEKRDAGEKVFSAREYTLISEDAVAIMENHVSLGGSDALSPEYGGELLYITERGLWEYVPDAGESRFLAGGIDNACTVYILGKHVYYEYLNTLYEVLNGVGTAVVADVQKVLCTDDEEGLLCLDSKGKLFLIGDRKELLEEDVDDIGAVYGMEGFAMVTEEKLVSGREKGGVIDRIFVTDSNITSSTKAIVMQSRKYLYYVDDSNILWKMSKDGGNRESLGYVQHVVYVK